jgi:hypothetical protein
LIQSLFAERRGLLKYRVSAVPFAGVSQREIPGIRMIGNCSDEYELVEKDRILKTSLVAASSM